MSMHTESTTARTVVLWNDSAPASHARDWAVERTRRCAGELVIVRPVPSSSSTSDPADRTIVAARFSLETQVMSLRNAFPALRVVVKLVEGDLYDELAALSNISTLVVIGTHDRATSSFAFARSIGARFAAIASGPVAVIPESAPTQVDRIVIGIDGSAPSTAAAEFAAGEAVARGLELTMLHAWQEPMPWQDVYAQPDEEFVRELEEAHRHVLDDAVALVQGRYPSLGVHPRLVRGAAPWALLDAAGESGLLVVGTRGLHRLKAFLLGSVSHAIVLNLRSAVVVVPGRHPEA